ncbi:kynureninase [Rhizoclosmatium globosum]|uniref:Kynureninase n=1 Tax=Rhizoclosmatium globosum TaxID=329046 RepID=A0A1Y2D2G1_9FUNG|nr:kynureninase [Rhizoclosmatium globosum]|eukprot:ORY53481.1 kynureninase [Rhizoclosmatium globosum]
MIGNSLGLQPVATRKLINEELDVWADRGVNGHFDHPLNRPWVSVDDNVLEQSARIVGAKSTSEVAIMNTLTSNLHFLLVSFYRPTPLRYKIIMEAKAFPSDFFAFASQTTFHGFDPKDAIIEVKPRDGEFTLRIEDIVDVIRKEGDKVALVLFSGVQYYTGQFFDLKRITEEGHAIGARVGFDLAHAAGNVPLQLHDWNVDFAAWCTYKYLNGGPGNIGGLFVHSKFDGEKFPRLAGWWGSDPATKFTMDNQFHGIPGAAGYRLSNPSVLAVTSLLGSLQTFEKTSMQELRERSLLLTGYLEHLLLELHKSKPHFKIITPSDPEQRGCQLSVLFEPGQMERVFEALLNRGIVCDERRPDVIRISPAPLYCTFEDVWKTVDGLKEVL